MSFFVCVAAMLSGNILLPVILCLFLIMAILLSPREP